MDFRVAEITDFPNIAKLHAESWHKHYRGILSDHYLDDILFQDRQKEWQKRAKEDPKGRYIILAEENEELIGFACTYLNHKNSGESLLDNLHVSSPFQGRGLGLSLLKASYDWAKKESPSGVFYLTVLKDNIKSKEFYYRFGGQFDEESIIETWDKKKVAIERISWNQRPKNN